MIGDKKRKSKAKRASSERINGNKTTTEKKKQDEFRFHTSKLKQILFAFSFLRLDSSNDVNSALVCFTD